MGTIPEDKLPYIDTRGQYGVRPLEYRFPITIPYLWNGGDRIVKWLIETLPIDQPRILLKTLLGTNELRELYHIDRWRSAAGDLILGDAFIHYDICILPSGLILPVSLMEEMVKHRVLVLITDLMIFDGQVWHPTARRSGLITPFDLSTAIYNPNDRNERSPFLQRE